jgi:predicted DsbA family dithiol-disulfide isomerase
VPTTVQVDIWSDIACPWCFIGKRRFEKAAEKFKEQGGDVNVVFHSFELAPDTPVDFDGDEVDFLVKHKGLPPEQVRQMLAQVTEIAAGEGLNYDFEALQHTKTLKAHEALHFAKAHGLQLELSEALFSAYFEHGRHIGDVEQIADIAAAVGLDRDQLISALKAGTYAADVEADIRQAAAYQIRGVPFFVLNSRLGVSGAQSPEVFLDALTQAAGA